MLKIYKSLAILFLALMLSKQVRAESYSIDGVVVEGNRRIDSGAIIQQAKVSHGTVSSDVISEDVKGLYNSGFFDQVSASVVNVSGRTLLKFKVVEKPEIRKVFIKGNEEIKEDDIAEILKLDTNRFLDKTRIDGLVRLVTAFYQSKGFYEAKFESSVTPVGDNQVDLTLTVTEGQKFRVREVVVRGVKELDEGDILSELQTKEYKWWSSWLFGTGRVNEDMMDADKQIIRQFLLDRGYIDGTAGDGVVEKRSDGLYVTYDVTEGKRYKLGEIRASGDLVHDQVQDTIEDIDSESGEYFNASKVRSDIFKITDKFSDDGYAYANVVPNTSVNRDAGIVDLDFNVNKGQKVSINQINITGNEKTYDNVIRRELKIGEQSTYSGTKIKRSQTLLQRLGYFDEVAITNEPTADPSIVDLNVNVREASTGSFSAGAGYSTSDGALFNAKISENNILGTGRRANLNLDFGTERNNQVLSFDDPRVNDSKVSWGVDLARTDREYSDFDRELKGITNTVGYPAEEIFGEVAEDVSLALKYDLARVNINDVAQDAAQLVKDSEGESISSSLGPVVTRNTINNPLNPISGSKQIFSYEYGGLGGDENFYVFEARNSWYYPLIKAEWGEIVVSDRTTFGYGESTDDDPFPLFRRYFPGGINSVRGYKTRTLGPKDENGNEYGGSKQLVNNLELIFPILNSAGIKGVVFYDIGNAYDDNQSMDLSELREAYGYGLRWASPLGPIRVEFGYPIDREQDEKHMITMFSFGAPL